MATIAAQGQTCRNFINGEWAPSRSPRFVERHNPAHREEVVSVVPLSSVEEARDAVGAARSALPAWQNTPAPARGRILARATQEMERRKNELARLITREEGKTIDESLAEVVQSVRILEFMAGEGSRLAGQTVPSDWPKHFVCTIRQPVGVVGVIASWDFPLSTPVRKIAPAVVAGNTVVLKPSTFTSLSAAALLEILAEAGMPPGVVNMVVGSGREAGVALVEHSDVRAISFAGSRAVGASVCAAAAGQMKKCRCETGGQNPLVVLRDADLELAADAAVYGAFTSTGQRCTSSSLAVVEDEVADGFMEMVASRARSWKVGNGLDPAVSMGPVVNEQHLEAALRYIERGKATARLVVGGERLKGEAYDIGYFLAPTVFDHADPDSSLIQDEISGPILSVIRVGDFEQAIAAVNAIPRVLSSGIYANDATKIFAFVERTGAGATHVNSPTIGSEAHLPSGAATANGAVPRETVHVALDFFTELKTVYIDYSGSRRTPSVY